MEITLKNLKVAASLSQETTAYTATICVDGVPAFHARNDGNGGCDFYQPVQGYAGPTEKEVNDWLIANNPPYEGHGLSLPHDLEMHVGDLIDRDVATKRLNRLLKSKIVVLGEHKGKPALFTIKATPTPENIARYVAKVALENGVRKESRVVVNGNADAFADALALA